MMSPIELDSHLDRITTVAGGARQLVIFDLDHTLIAGYSALALAAERLRRGELSGLIGGGLELVRDLLRARGGHGGNYRRYMQRLAQALTGCPESYLEGLGQSAWERTLSKALYPEALALVEAHRRAGHQLAIVTAATRYQAEPIARALGIDVLYCTRLAARDGRLTGALQGPLCFGEGKAVAARRIARAHGLDLASAYFYSDSDEDLPLLRCVGFPVAVNPSARLEQIAGVRGWPLLQFDSRGVPSIESLVRTVLTVNTVASTALYSVVKQRLRGASAAHTASRGLATLIGDVTATVAGLEFDVSGAEYLVSDQPAVYVFNHQSFLDTVVLARLLRHDAVALCKRELATNPLFGPLMAAMGVIYVDRDASDQRDTIERARAVLASGRSLVIAPEGTRSADGRIGTFKTGAFYLAKKARVPLVPIVLHNVHAALPKGGWLIRPARIRVTVLPPIEPDAIGGLRESCAILRETYRRVLAEGRYAVA